MIYGLADPLAPVEVGGFDVHEVAPFTVVAGFLYMGGYNVEAWDVSDPANVRPRGRFFRYAADVNVGSGRLFYTDRHTLYAVDMGPEFRVAGGSCTCVTTESTTPPWTVALGLLVALATIRCRSARTSARRSARRAVRRP